jgi:predicted GH43/DUF377 family glycosyl hydrolase
MKKILIIAALLSVFLIKIYYYYSYPKILRNVKKSDEIGIVKAIKEIKINGVSNPINGSLENYNNIYILTFRINEKVNKKENNYIGITYLDESFNEIVPFKKIDVKSSNAEDPRIFKFKSDYYLIYNDQMPIDHPFRVMHLAKLNNKNDKVEYITPLDQQIKIVEKNWSPFIYENSIYLSYGLVPHKIMQVLDPKQNNIKHLIFPNNLRYSRFFWNFGEPRGGSAAKLVDGQYLAFFHSCFGKSKNKKYYVMGAYTFEATPPFKITKISKFPIIFGDAKKTRIYFPTGFVIKKENDKELIYLSYGENDKTSKIAIIDKEKLFESLKEVY